MSLGPEGIGIELTASATGMEHGRLELVGEWEHGHEGEFLIALDLIAERVAAQVGKHRRSREAGQAAVRAIEREAET